MKISIRFLSVFFLLILLNSCLVSKKKFDAETLKALNLANEKNECNKLLQQSRDSVALLQNSNTDLNKKLAALTDEKNILSNDLAKNKKELIAIGEQYDAAKKQLDEISNKSIAEKNKLSVALLEKEAEIKRKEEALAKNTKALEDRENKIKELEDLLLQKAKTVEDLKKKIADALSAFSAEELNVTQKDGKVYISLSDKLLFKTGSTKVDEKGRQAILKLSEELNKNAEIAIEIEGHTDSIPYINPKGEIKNNWDLSVLRATMVAAIMINEGKVLPTRIKPAGKAEYMPVATNETAEGRSKNRRIEIILNPNISAILKLLNE